MKKLLKSPPAWIAFILAGAVALLFWRLDEAKGVYDDLLQENVNLSWEITTLKAEKDSIIGLGEYSKPDTVWGDSILVPYPYAVHDTLPPDSVWLPFPRIRGNVSFDTTVSFGEDKNPLSVRVRGKFFFPEQPPDTNWAQVLPKWGKPPVSPVTSRTRNWSLGLNFSGFSQGWAGLGLTGRYKRVSATAIKQLSNRHWTFTLNYNIIQ